MKNKISLLPVILSCLLVNCFYLTGCTKREDIKASEVKPEVIITDSRATLIHLYKDTVYILKGELERKEHEELIVDAGTLIKVISDDFNSLGGIKVDPGGIIRINGTGNEPVVFTSNVFTGNQKENWTGINITGRASDNNLGAGDSTDFSGSISYLRIEFAALTMNAVGSNTVVDNVMVSYTNSSGQLEAPSSFTFYGGSFNAKHLISYACGGPADFYITNGYNGKLQQLIAYRNPLFGNTGLAPASALAGMLIENNNYGNVNATPLTNPSISNLTILGPSAQNGSSLLYADTTTAGFRTAALVADGNAFFKIKNSLLAGFPEAALYINDGLTAANVEHFDAAIANSILQANDSSRTFFLNPTVYLPYTSVDLKNYLLANSLNNRLFLNVTDFKIHDPFNYELPGLTPDQNAPVLTGADFTDPVFNDAFFDKVNYLGAIGDNNWLQGWTNFIPLRTNYNFAE